MLFCQAVDAAVELVELFAVEVRGNAEGKHRVSRHTAHGGDIA